VTPARRVAGREVVTLEGLDEPVRKRWVDAFAEAGASQCGFCTPGILMRLVAAERKTPHLDHARLDTALAAHLCRCTGWWSILDAAGLATAPTAPSRERPPRDALLGSWRAELEGGNEQAIGPVVVEGGGGFASDAVPAGALVALCDDGRVALGVDLADARRALPKIQGRRSGIPLRHPVEIPPGEWALTLQTTWVEPAYLEPDASWCRPDGPPASPLANGGAFGGKRASPLPAVASRLAAEHGRPVLAMWTREEVVRRGPKRPPVAAGMRSDGTGVLRVARTPGSSLAGYAAVGVEGLLVEEVDVPGPPVGVELRGAGWAETTVLRAAVSALRDGSTGPGVPVEVNGRDGGRARVVVGDDESVVVDVWAGEVLDETVLRSYCLGAVHQALGWVRSEGIAVDGTGRVQDLTVRSFGVLTARDTPPVTVSIHPSSTFPVNGSDAVFAATAAAAWLADGLPPAWPTRRHR
jgi:hypothetical protein